ncbi:MAG: protein phosphatase 2C domain-containing protein [Ruminococcus sp.]|nr:protein phosphatase 2C domain-containing protein [Ruminococcus sp.]
MFNAFSKSVMGQSHVKKNIVCQDSSAHKVTDDYAIAVVADGHGSKKHFRSNIGSKCAVEATLEVLARFMETEGFFETFPERRSSVIKNIEKQVIACWNEKVNAHHDANPVTVVEKKPFTHDEFAEIPVESYYGTTLICGVMCKDFTFGFQLGDGSLVTVLEDGTTSMPMDYNEQNPANITSSMCNANAASMFAEFYSVEPKVAALFASTDGLYTTFGGEQAFFDYHTLIASQLIDPEKVRASVENNIAKRTHYGTEDDISFACAVNGDLLAECRPALINKVAENKRAAAEKKVKN